MKPIVFAFLCAVALPFLIGCDRNDQRLSSLDYSWVSCPACNRCHDMERPVLEYTTPAQASGEFRSQESKPQPVNQEALNQPKTQWGGCSNGRCRQPSYTFPSNGYYYPNSVPSTPYHAPTIVPSNVVVQTPSLPANTVSATAAAEVKTGVYGCSKCGKPTVGQDWHQVWTRDGASALYLCERCWEASTPAQRKQHLEKYLEKHGLAERTKEAFREVVR